MKTFHIFILLAIFNLSAFSQHEFLARVNPPDLSFTTFDSIPGVAWISVNTGTMDENNHRFFFIGAPPNFTPSRLYTLDALTGAIIYNPLIPSNFSSSSYLGGLEYDNNSDTLYGLFQDGTTLNWYLAWIDYTNGFVHPKYNQQATTFGIGSTTYDKNHHRYFYSMGNTQYVLDAHTGQVIYSYTLPYYYYDLKYNNSNDKLYCISNPVNPLNFEFDTVEIATGILHTISNMPFHYVVGTPMLKAIDETNGRYFCVAGLTNTSSQLYTINIQNGNVIYSPFDTLLGNQHNLIEIHYENVLDTLYALYWEQGIANGQTLSLYDCSPIPQCMTSPCQAVGAVCPLGGTSPYSYLWTPGGQTTQSVTGLCQGNYTVTVTDAMGATASTTVSIPAPSILDVSCSANPTTIIAGNSATITAAPSGGAPPYIYFWTPSFYTTNPIVVSPTTSTCYTVTVTDANGCTDTSSVCVTVTPTGINEYVNNISFTISPNPFCSQTVLQSDKFFHNATVSIENCFGQTVKQIKNISGQTIILQRDNLPSGIYFVKVFDREKSYCKKLIVE